MNFSGGSEIIMKDNKYKLINHVEIINRYATFSTEKNDVIFGIEKIKYPIFCGGFVNNFSNNIYNLKKNEFVGYLSYKNDLNIVLSSNLICKLNYEDKNLMFILPYASYAMKILRMINPKLGNKILIIGLNFFSILLKKLMDFSGADIFIVKLENDYYNNENWTDEFQILDGMNEVFIKLNKMPIDSLILTSNLNQIENKSLSNLNIKKKMPLNQISIYDKGFEDLNYLRGIQYPYPYVRWDYKKNLEYFIYLVENDYVNLKFLQYIIIEVNSISMLANKFKNLEKNCLYLFKLLSES